MITSNDMKHRILELYSGIGGMHCAWNASSLAGEVVAAVDINTVANEVYKHNFPETNLINRNIQSITPKEIKNLNINTILMSPPCQPFTRNGNYLDENDPRTDSFTYLIRILNELENIEFILMENVKGFECSAVRNLFIEELKENKFEFQEFLLCPTMAGVPNSRLRYYCLARRTKTDWSFIRKDGIITRLEKSYDKPFALERIIEKEVPNEFLLPDKYLKRANILDICHKESMRSCCFTKAYSHYLEGTGSVFTNHSPEMVRKCFEKAKMYQVGSNEFIQLIKELELRFFTPEEVSSLMSFPKKYSFPESISRKQCYRLLGNSVNVKVVSELIKILFE